MAKIKKPQKLKKSLFSSYLTTTLSISMILFLFGLMGLMLINAKRLSDYVMENIGVTLILKDGAKEVDVMKLQKTLEATNYIKSTKFVDKESAATELKSELGEDFVDFLG
jgi:cell division transport system permease protein